MSKVLAILVMAWGSVSFAAGYSSSMDFTYGTNTNVTGSNNASNGLMGFYNSYTFENNFTTKLNLGASRQFQKDQDNQLIDGRLDFKLPMYKGDTLSVTGETRMGLGFSDASKQNEEFITYFTFTPTFWFDLGASGGTTFGFLYKPYITQNFHKEDTFQRGGETFSQIDRFVNNLFGLNITVQEKLSIDLMYFYKTNWNADGDRVDDSYILNQEVSYNFGNGVSFLVGHAYSNFFYAEGENDSVQATNFTLYSQDDSLYYVTLTLRFI